MKIVQVFKTNVQNLQDARHIILFLRRNFSHCRINFDLDDCDRILRIESRKESVQESEIRSLMAGYGFHCEPLQG